MSDSNGQRADATVEDVARHFGVSERTVWRWLKDTEIPHRRVPAGDRSTVRFNIAEVDAWAARGGRPADEPTEKSA
jgi:excisionase family DNA binding protein